MLRVRMGLGLVAAAAVFSLIQVGAHGATHGALIAASEPYGIIPDPDFVVPPGGRSKVDPLPELAGSSTTLFRPNGSVYATQVADEKGRPVETTFYNDAGLPTVVIDADYPAEGAVPAAPSGTASDEGALLASVQPAADPDAWLASHIYCGDNEQDDGPNEWGGTMHWRINTGSIPSGINVDNTVTNLRGARITWEDNVTWCTSIGDSSSMNFTYDGTTTASYGSNGVSTVGWGEIDSTACSSTAIACSRKDLMCVRVCVIVEADIRFSDDHDWINGQSSCCYDIKHVAVHETGHNIGFQHVSSTSHNVMCDPCQRKNDTSGRKLGKGDANLNNSEY